MVSEVPASFIEVYRTWFSDAGTNESHGHTGSVRKGSQMHTRNGGIADQISTGDETALCSRVN